MKKTRRAGIAILTVLSVLACLFLFLHFYFQINRQFPNPSVERYAIGQPLNYNSVEIVVQDFRITTWTGLLSLFPDTDFYYDPIEEKNISDGDQMKVALITVTLKNTGDIEQRVPLYTTVLKTLTWCNGLDRDLFIDLNEDSISQLSTRPFLAPGEELTCLLPYTAIEGMLLHRDWERFDELTFEWQFDLYPVKKLFDLS
ncbi:MAG: DUF4352 domain-containing protein [Clostridiales bacterium]|nr:DUF4352 domain-containing protein [Clostridiales bacterium]